MLMNRRKNARDRTYTSVSDLKDEQWYSTTGNVKRQKQEVYLQRMLNNQKTVLWRKSVNLSDYLKKKNLSTMLNTKNKMLKNQK